MHRIESELTDHASFLRALAGRLVADPSAAEDLVQETYVAALTTRGEAPREPRAWLTTVLKRKASNTFRADRHRFQREHEASLAEGYADPASAAVEIEVAQRLLAHVEALEEPYRSTVFQRYYEGLKPKEIAARSGEPVGTVKTRLTRALGTLRSQLDQDDPRGRRSWLPAMAAIGRVDAAASKVTVSALGGSGLLGGVAIAAALVLLGLAWVHSRGASEPKLAGVPLVLGAGAEGAGDGMLSAGPPTLERRDALAIAVETAGGETRQSRVFDAPFGAAPGGGTPAAGVGVSVTLQGTPASLAELPEPSPKPAAGHLHEAPPEHDHAHRANVRIRTVELQTDEDGWFSVAVPNGAEVTKVLVAGSTSQREASWRAGTLAWPAFMTRSPRGHLSGTVVNLEGQPLEGVEVELGYRVDGKKQYRQSRTGKQGRFSFSHAHDSSWIRGTRDGWVLLGATRPTRTVSGEWTDAEIVMTQAGTLDISLVDRDGEAVPSLPLGVSVRAGEPCTEHFRFDVGGRFKSDLDESAWRDGRASLSVPSGVALTCNSELYGFLGQRDGIAESGSGSGHAVQPIVVPAGGRLHLTIQLQVNRMLRGRTVDAEGRSVANCALKVERRDEARGALPLRLALASNERGEFEFPVTSPAETVTLDIQATGPESSKEGPGATLFAATQHVVDHVDEGPIEIRLHPTSSQIITGRVVDAEGNRITGVDGRPVVTWIHLQPMGAEPGQLDRLPTGHGVRLRMDGSFSTKPIANGAYRLVATSDDYAPVIIENVRPGGPPLEIVPTVKRTVRVQLVGSHGPAPIRAFDVLIGRFASSPGPLKSVPGLGDASLDFARAPGTWFSTGDPEHPLGRLLIERVKLEAVGGKAELSVEPGVVWLGVFPRDAGFAKMERMTTGLVRGEPGSWKLSVHPSPVVPVTCRAPLESALTEQLFAAFVDSSGHHLQGSSASAWILHELRRFPIGTYGDFGVREVPIGPWHVWVGSRAELDAAQPRFDEWIEVTEDGPRHFVLGSR